jgi:opacity protein-like surface antigen
MKKTVLAIGLVLALSLSAAASFEFYGGGSYNTFDPESLNDLIKLANDELDEWKEGEAFPIALPGEDEDEDIVATVTITKLTKTKLDDLKAGFGAFGGVRYWVNPTVAVGGEIEYIGAKSEGSAEGTVKFPSDTPVYGGKTVDVSIDSSISASVTGFSGACAFKASPELTVFASAGYYYLNGGVELNTKTDGLGSDAEIDEKGKSKFTDKGLGFKAGVAFAYPVADELSIVGRAAYRSLKFDEIEFDDDEKYGLEEEVDEIAALADEEIDFSGLEIGLGIVYNF